MHRENHFYGHAEVLARYAGLARPPRIAGHLQHGWQHETGVVPDCVGTRWPKLIWSRRNLDACRAAGVRRVVPIGSPYLYLPPPETESPEPRGLLAFPFHGWSGGEVVSVEASYEAYAVALEALRDEGFESITVCMYWLEHEKPDLRAVFDRRGFRVTTAGAPGDVRFLHRFRSLVLEHEHVTANRIATCTFYALSAGRPFFLHGPPIGLHGTADRTGETIRAWEEREFPSLLRERFEGRVEGEIADRELGLEFRLDPDALRETLGWSRTGLARLGRGVEMTAWRATRGLWRLIRS